MSPSMIDVPKFVRLLEAAKDIGQVFYDELKGHLMHRGDVTNEQLDVIAAEVEQKALANRDDARKRIETLELDHNDALGG